MPLTLCIRETPKWILLQTVNTHMKSNIMRYFIKVYTVCKGKKYLQKKNKTLLKIITWHP